MPKKSNKTRADGRIAVQVYLGKGEDGKRKVKTVYGKTQKEANQKADELRASLGKGLDISKERDTFENWAELFLAAQKKKLTDSEYKSKKRKINYFYSYFGKSKIKLIKVFEIEEAINDLAKENPSTGKPSAAKTLRGYKQACSQVFDFAVKNRVVEFNPVEYAELPNSAPKAERRALSETERKWIEELSSKQRGKRAAMIAMYCGLRRGEMTALTWNDIDFENNTITINKSYDFKNELFKFPKTAAGMRVVPMPKVLSDFLLNEPRTSIYVCCSAKKEMMSADGWKRLIESVLVDLELAHGTSKKKKKFDHIKTVFTIEPFGWHDLRHTYATILYEAGVDVLTAQYLLGHASPETTMKIYTHLSEAQKSRSIVKLDEFLSKSETFKSDSSQTG